MAEWAIGTVKRPNLVGYPSYRLKLVRALEHLGELYAATQTFGESSTYTVTIDHDPNTGEHVLNVDLRSQPPIGISILAADCVHNLRQALDHLAFDFAVLIGGDPPPNEETAMFPIYSTLAKNQTIVLDDGRLSSKIGRPKDIPPILRTELENLQPYYGGDLLRLAVLNDLENRAKHRTLPVCVGAIRTAEAAIDGVEVTSIFEGPLEIGKTEIGRFRSAKTEVYMQGSFSIEVMFAGESPAAGTIVTQFIHETREFLLKRVVGPLEAIIASWPDP